MAGNGKLARRALPTWLLDTFGTGYAVESEVFKKPDKPEFSGFDLYVHVPFCPSVCEFCDLIKETDEPNLRGRYLDALEAQAQRISAAYEGKLARSVYFGGGSPSILSERQLTSLMLRLWKSFDINEMASVTLESRTDHITENNLALWKGLGINRLSLGVQTLDDSIRERHGIKGTSAKIEEKLDMVKERFARYNVDLIFGWRDEPMGSWQRTLEEMIELRPYQITTYPLIEQKNKKYGLIDNLALNYDQFQKARHLFRELHDAGYTQNDSFTFTDTSKHVIAPEVDTNLIAHKCQDLVGLGSGACSYTDRIYVNPYSAKAFADQAKSGREMEYVRIEPKLFLSASTRSACMTKDLLSRHGIEGLGMARKLGIFITWKLMLDALCDWNVTSHRVGYSTGSGPRQFGPERFTGTYHYQK